MKNKLFIFFIIVFIGAAHAGYNICGPAVSGLEMSYSTITSGMGIAHWVVGTGCNGEMADTGVENMCVDVVVGGEAICNWDFWSSIKSTYEYTREGSFCWCRRTHAKRGGTLIENIGEWGSVSVGSGVTGVSCRSVCARFCAEAVVQNSTGLRNYLMLAPKL